MPVVAENDLLYDSIGKYLAPPEVPAAQHRPRPCASRCAACGRASFTATRVLAPRATNRLGPRSWPTARLPLTHATSTHGSTTRGLSCVAHLKGFPALARRLLRARQLARSRPREVCLMRARVVPPPGSVPPTVAQRGHTMLEVCPTHVWAGGGSGRALDFFP